MKNRKCVTNNKVKRSLHSLVWFSVEEKNRRSQNPSQIIVGQWDGAARSFQAEKHFYLRSEFKQDDSPAKSNQAISELPLPSVSLPHVCVCVCVSFTTVISAPNYNWTLKVKHNLFQMSYCRLGSSSLPSAGGSRTERSWNVLLLANDHVWQGWSDVPAGSPNRSDTHRMSGAK